MLQLLSAKLPRELRDIVFCLRPRINNQSSSQGDMNALTLDLEDQTTWTVLPESYHVSLRSIAPYLAENKREAYPQITKGLAQTYYETAVHRFVHTNDLKSSAAPRSLFTTLIWRP
jgi:hypothetical protein